MYYTLTRKQKGVTLQRDSLSAILPVVPDVKAGKSGPCQRAVRRANG